MHEDQLPSGSVTFVFTDIEGSTKLVQALGGERWLQVLDAHNEIIRAAFDPRGGFEIKTEGDAFFVVFADAAEAVAACLDAELALANHDWGDHPVRVRIGMHTGEAAVVGRDYVGLAVHEAARVAGAAHGGQVIVSDGTASAMGDVLPPHASLRDLGRHALKDLIGPRTIYQLVHPDLVATFPPPRTLSATEHNVPAPPTGLVGRDTERAETGRLLLDEARLVTLTGPGGIGKTRLALEVAHDMRAYHPGGVWFVPLAGVRESTGLLPAIAETLGVREQGTGLAPAIQRRLGGGSTLLVLDNLEQVLDAVPDIADLIASLPELKVLATSRERLRLRGERVVAVPPLGLGEQGEAASLFAERAAALGCPVGEADAVDVVKVVAALDGVPLAIELAAARLPDVGLRGLVEATSSLLDVLTEGERDLPVRQRTLRAALAWSHDLLEADAKAVFARLSVFAGTIPAEAVEAVCGSGSSGSVMVLVAKSLVQSDGERLLMLEPIRQLAAEHLAESGEHAIRAGAHADWFTDMAEQADSLLLGPSQASWLRRLAEQHDNLRVALDHGAGRHDTELRLAGALARYWYIRGHWTEGTAALERALAASEGGRAADAGALVGLGALAIAQSDLEGASAALEEAKTAASTAENALLGARAANGLADVARQRGDLPGARAHLAQARALAGGDAAVLASIAINEGLVAMAEGDFEAATASMDAAIALNGKMGNLRGEALAILNRGHIAQLSGDLEGAQERYEQSLGTLTEIGEQAGAAAALENLSEVLRLSGALDRALTVAEQLLHVRRKVGDEAGEARAVGQLGLICGELGRDQEALAWFERGIVVTTRRSDDSLTAWFHRLLAETLEGLGRSADAAREIEAAAAAYRASGFDDDADYCRTEAERLREKKAGV